MSALHFFQQRVHSEDALRVQVVVPGTDGHEHCAQTGSQSDQRHPGWEDQSEVMYGWF